MQALNLVALIVIALAGARAAAQTPQPTPLPQATPPPAEVQDKIKVFTEEVVIPVTAYDASGHLSAAPEPYDILVFEDDVRQEVRSIRRIPANVRNLFVLIEMRCSGISSRDAKFADSSGQN